MKSHTREAGGRVDQARLLLEDVCSDLVRFLPVSLGWQRRIDHVQPRQGVHVAMAMGRIQLVPMRALDHARLATIGECLDITARLLPLADQGEIVVSNVLRHAIGSAGLPCELDALPPFDARSLGMLQPWRLASAAPTLRGVPDLRVSSVTDARSERGRNVPGA